jgi:hypothetical protein
MRCVVVVNDQAAGSQLPEEVIIGSRVDAQQKRHDHDGGRQ